MTLFTCILLLNQQGCKNSEESVKGCSDFHGITKTNKSGDIIGPEDSNDWKKNEFLRHFVAYPNPFYRKCTIVFAITDTAHIKITINTRPDHVIHTLIDSVYEEPAAIDFIDWDVRHDEFPHCVYRVYITATTDDNVYKSYGDIEIKL